MKSKKYLSIVLALALSCMMIPSLSAATGNPENDIASSNLFPEQIEIQQTLKSDLEALARDAAAPSTEPPSTPSVFVYSFAEIPQEALEEAENTFHFFVSSALKMPEIFPGRTEEEIKALRMGSGYAPHMIGHTESQSFFFPILTPDGEALRMVSIDFEHGKVTGISTGMPTVKTYNAIVHATSKEKPTVISTDIVITYASLLGDDATLRTYLTEAPYYALDAEQAAFGLSMRDEAMTALERTSASARRVVEIGYQHALPLEQLQIIEKTTVAEKTEEVLVLQDETPLPCCAP